VARGDDILQGVNSGSGPPQGSAGPLDTQIGPPGEVQNLHRYKTGPLGRVPDPSGGGGPGHSQQGPRILGEGVPGP
jgi:hypothetical protein